MEFPIRNLLRYVGAAVGGYLVIAAGQILVLEVGLGGEVRHDSSPWVLGLAGLGTVLSGLIGGFLTAWMGGSRPLFPLAGVLVLLALDAVYVIVNRVGGEPLWFNLGGAVTLMAATAAGGWLRARARMKASMENL